MFAVLEYEDELGLGVDDIVEADNVDVLEFFHERYLADRGRRGAFFGVEVNFFQRHYLICGPRPSL